jgi:hypothetical protein
MPVMYTHTAPPPTTHTTHTRHHLATDLHAWVWMAVTKLTHVHSHGSDPHSWASRALVSRPPATQLP